MGVQARTLELLPT